MKKIVKIIIILGIIPATLFSCTGIFLKTDQNRHVYARTLEFGQDLQSKILFMPRNYTLRGATPAGENTGLEWQTKYAAIGTNAFDENHFIDGVNEVGLAGGLFYFPGFAEYQIVNEQDYAQSLPIWQLLTWILTNFSTVCEVKNALPSVLVSATVFPPLNEVVPAHLIVHDTLGNSIVVEYTNGQLHIHDNPLGVITNSPNFEWHMTNLRNYIHLSPVNSAPRITAGLTLKQLGQGSGMLGLPGDFTPPSRFVRAVAYQQASPLVATELEGVYQAFHILNNFDIPYGAVRDASGDLEYTPWTSVTDLHNKIFYWRTHKNFQLQKVELMTLDLNAVEPLKIAMNRTEKIHNATNTLKNNRKKTEDFL